MTPADLIPPPMMDVIRAAWDRGEGVPEGKELYGIRWDGLTFMARQPSKPIFLEDHPHSDALAFIVGEPGGVTLTQGGFKHESEAATLERSKAVEIVASFDGEHLSDSVRKLLGKIQEAVRTGTKAE